MLETAVAQLRFATSLLSGRPFSPWSLEQMVKSLRGDAGHEFGAISAAGGEIVGGPAMDEETRQEMQRRRLRAQAVKATDTAYYAQLFGELGLDPTQIKQQADIARIPITGKESVREQPDAIVRRGSRPYLRATTTGTTGKPTSIAFSTYELSVYCAVQAISLLMSGEIQAGDIVQISTSGRGVLGNLCLAGACAHVGATVTMAGLLDPADTLARLAAREDTADVRRKVGEALEAQQVPLCELHLVLQARELRHPLPLRGDLREPELVAPQQFTSAGTPSTVPPASLAQAAGEM